MNEHSTYGWPGRNHGRGAGAAAKPKRLNSQVHRLCGTLPAYPALRTDPQAGNPGRPHPFDTTPWGPPHHFPLRIGSSGPASDAAGPRIRARTMKRPLLAVQTTPPLPSMGKGGGGGRDGGHRGKADGFREQEILAKRGFSEEVLNP